MFAAAATTTTFVALALVALVSAAATTDTLQHSHEDDNDLDDSNDTHPLQEDGSGDGAKGGPDGLPILKDPPEKMASENVDSKAAVAAVAKGNAQFLAKIYPSLVDANGQESNLVMSPFSVSSVLALAYAGAKGSTHDEMQKALNFPGDQEVKEGYKEIFNVLKSSDNFTLDAANRIFVNQKFHLLDTYLEQSKAYFAAEPQTVDFAKSEEARETINTWVEQKTHDKIKDLIPGGVLNDLTRAVLVNAVYFKGNWAVQFDKGVTRTDKFHVTPTETVAVDMMRITSEYKTAISEELGCTILDMPYKGERLSMLFFLSKKPEGFDQMEKKLANVDLSSISASHKTKYDVAIPKFKLETTHQLVEPLKALGMVEMFDETKADFSGMTGQKDLYVSEAIQKAFIEVNEEGSEAAAATGMVMMTRMAIMNPKFICDRPFLFAIKDNLTGMILFNGRVINPTKNN